MTRVCYSLSGMVVIALALLGLLELTLYLPPAWRWHRTAASGMSGLLVVSFGLLLWHFSAGLLLVQFLTLYRIINLARLVKDRMQTDYLYAVTRQTSASLIGCQVLIGLVLTSINIEAVRWLDLLAVTQLAVAATLLAVTWRNSHNVQVLPPVKPLPDNQLPSLTVAIPARNETDDLQACLASLVGSDYPKLEIIVLDDCSQNRHTSEIIRSFAHAGVRFIAGQVPPDNWLAKNYAYYQLAEAASGELVLFCGVDARFEVGSLRQLVGTLLTSKMQMVSWLPRNSLPQYWSGLLIQPSRYAWELTLPRNWLRRPPVLSTCWLITRGQLQATGGFKAISRNASPESYFARHAFRAGGYTFLATPAEAGVTSAKTLSEQQATAVRTRYLQAHRKPELAALVALAELGLVVGPVLLLLAALVRDNLLIVALSTLATACLALSYALVMRLAYRRWLWRALWLWPLAILADLGFLHYSMGQYEFGEVIWKGRNICLPVMRIPADVSPT